MEIKKKILVQVDDIELILINFNHDKIISIKNFNNYFH